MALSCFHQITDNIVEENGGKEETYLYPMMLTCLPDLFSVNINFIPNMLIFSLPRPHFSTVTFEAETSFLPQYPFFLPLK